MSGVSGSSAKENEKGRGNKSRYVRVRDEGRSDVCCASAQRVRVEGDIRKMDEANLSVER